MMEKDQALITRRPFRRSASFGRPLISPKRPATECSLSLSVLYSPTTYHSAIMV
jgi:hypothetical protein